MDFSRVVICDFETEAIEGRPKYPPEPVGFAVDIKGVEPYYVAWGHPSENNDTREQAQNHLALLWEDPSVQIVFHNANFDISVACEKLGMPRLPWQRLHDTMLLLFLENPHADKLGLKPSSERILGWPSEEQDELNDWIWNNRKALLAEYPGYAEGRVHKSKLGAWIAKAPGALVGRYAIGDVRRTRALFEFLYPEILRLGMGEAYDRERKLLPILMENESTGLRVDLGRLETDIGKYSAALEKVENLMRVYLSASGLSFDNDRDVANVFVERGVIHEDMWVRTAKSNQLSVAKDNLPPEAFVDPLFASAYGYRNRLVTALKMFMVPWFEQARVNNGYIHTSWNQVRSSRSDKTAGARTGRPSMSKPNLLNVSKDFEDKDDGYVHPAALELPQLPLARMYVLADPDELFLHRDFDGQELRVFGHFESGDLMQAYLEDPKLDPHSFVGAEITRLTGMDLGRTSVKIMNFQSLYGGGVPAISKKLGISHAEAKKFKAFHEQALSGRKLLSNEILRIVRRDEPIRTWGGRLYYVEPPSYSKALKRHMTWEYKLINYLVQGSAADLTKEAICAWHYGGGPAAGARFLVTVYDEINISAPKKGWKDHMAFLREIMEEDRLEVPMRSSGKVGERWGELSKCD